MVGAILIGDKNRFSEFKAMIASGMELGDKRESLLGDSRPLKPIEGTLVCSCNGVGSGNIETEIQKGILTVEGIGVNTGAGTGCGSCRPEISRIIKGRSPIISPVAE